MTNPSVIWACEDFNIASRAIRDTQWSSNPANPSQHQTGLVQRGDLVWFCQAHFGSGPNWQPVRLADNTMCYVEPKDFESL